MVSRYTGDEKIDFAQLHRAQLALSSQEAELTLTSPGAEFTRIAHRSRRATPIGMENLRCGHAISSADMRWRISPSAKGRVYFAIGA